MTKLMESKTGEQLVADDVRNPEVATELARTAVANQLAILIIQYRVDHGLTQTALARMLGMKQPAVARLESGDHEPTVATLARLSRHLGITLRLEVGPNAVNLVALNEDDVVARVLEEMRARGHEPSERLVRSMYRTFMAWKDLGPSAIALDQEDAARRLVVWEILAPHMASEHTWPDLLDSLSAEEWDRLNEILAGNTIAYVLGLDEAPRETTTKYDPDRMNSDDLDFSNPEVIDAWLDNPVTEALTVDLGRAFRQLPSEQQRTELLIHLQQTEARRLELDKVVMNPSRTPEFRANFDELKAQLDGMIIAIKHRLTELS